MKCPHCGKSVSCLAREINRWGKEPTCPHCHAPVKLYVSWKVVAALIVPTALLSDVLIRVAGLNRSLVCGLLTVLLVSLATRLKLPAKLRE